MELDTDAFESDAVIKVLQGLRGHAGGQALWIHGDETPRKGRRRAKVPFLLQISQSLAGAHLNLGEGTLYVFADGSVVLQN